MAKIIRVSVFAADFSEPEWISRRERITRHFTKKILGPHKYLLVKNWARWYGIDCYGIHWTAVKNECEHNIAVTEQKKRCLSLTELVEIKACFSEQLYSISQGDTRPARHVRPRWNARFVLMEPRKVKINVR